MVTLIDPELQATLRASSSDSDSTVDVSIFEDSLLTFIFIHPF